MASATPNQNQTGLPPVVTTFVLDVAERAGKTGLQFVAAFLLPLIAAGTFSIFDTNWLHVLDIFVEGGIFSALTSLGSQPFGNANTASLVPGNIIKG